MKKILRFFFTCFLVFSADICYAQQRNIADTVFLPVTAPAGIAYQAAVVPTLFAAEPALSAVGADRTTIEELIMSPIIIPVGVAYGASMIAFSAVGAVIAAPFALPMMIYQSRKEEAESERYRRCAAQYYRPPECHKYFQR